MNAVVFYSNSGESRLIAEYLHSKSLYELIELEKTSCYDFDNLIVVFPVYCQNIPDVVKEFINKISVSNLSVVATYGKKSFGNVIYEISKLKELNIISYAYVPTKHTYIDDDFRFTDYSKLDCLLDKFNNPSKVEIKKYFKNPFANALMLKRSQSNIKIIKTDKCNGCGICNKSCAFVDKGVPNNKCIRCLKCVKNCPKKSLIIKKSFMLNVYLKIIKKDKLIIKV